MFLSVSYMVAVLVQMPNVGVSIDYLTQKAVVQLLTKSPNGRKWWAWPRAPFFPDHVVEIDTELVSLQR